MELKNIREVNIMEIKATLNKPYTDKQRLDFIVLNNHNKGYEIKETESNRGGRGGSGGGAGKIVWLKINR